MPFFYTTTTTGCSCVLRGKYRMDLPQRSLFTIFMISSGSKGLVTNSDAPSLMASIILFCWPAAVTMMTLALPSTSLIHLRASRPSITGIVMSRVTRSGLSSLNLFTPSCPSIASPMTSCPARRCRSDIRA